MCRGIFYWNYLQIVLNRNKGTEGNWLTIWQILHRNGNVKHSLHGKTEIGKAKDELHNLYNIEAWDVLIKLLKNWMNLQGKMS